MTYYIWYDHEVVESKRKSQYSGVELSYLYVVLPINNSSKIVTSNELGKVGRLIKIL